MGCLLITASLEQSEQSMQLLYLFDMLGNSLFVCHLLIILMRRGRLVVLLFSIIGGMRMSLSVLIHFFLLLPSIDLLIVIVTLLALLVYVIMLVDIVVDINFDSSVY